MKGEWDGTEINYIEISTVRSNYLGNKNTSPTSQFSKDEKVHLYLFGSG